MFIIQLKPATTRDGGGHQCYTIVYYFKDASTEESTNRSADPDVQTISQEIGNTIPTIAASGLYVLKKAFTAMNTQFISFADDSQ